MSLAGKENGIPALRGANGIQYRLLAVGYSDRRGHLEIRAYLGNYRIRILKVGIVARNNTEVGNTVRRLGPSAAVAALGENVFADRSIAEEWSAALNLLLDLAASVPVYALACMPDERAVCALEEAMARERREV